MFSSCNTVKSSTNPDKNNSKFCTSGVLFSDWITVKVCLFKMFFLLQNRTRSPPKKNYLKEKTNATSWNPSFLRVPRYVVCMFFLNHLFLTARSARLRLHQMLVWHARKAEKLKSKSFIQLIIVLEPPKKKLPNFERRWRPPLIHLGPASYQAWLGWW